MKKPKPPGLQRRLDDILWRYRRAMLDVYNHPRDEQGQRISAALRAYRQEMAAIGGDVPAGDDE